MTRDEALQKLADVIPPPAPDDTAGWWLGAAAAAVIIATVAGAWRWRRKRAARPAQLAPRLAAQTQLQNLRAHWQAKTIDDRDAAYRLAAILRLGLALPHLPEAPPPVAADDAALWRETLRQLRELRYTAAGAPPLSASLFDHAQRWLAAEAPR